MAAFTLAQAVGTPIWGRISDAYGRRMVLILTMFGSALAYVMLAYADELWIVMLSRVFGGLMAGNISAAFAYVTDITTDENRSAGLGKVGAATGLGFIFGPAIGGLLAFEQLAASDPCIAWRQLGRDASGRVAEIVDCHDVVLYGDVADGIDLSAVGS